MAIIYHDHAIGVTYRAALTGRPPSKRGDKVGGYNKMPVLHKSQKQDGKRNTHLRKYQK
nr:MAG TPA: hypothetical protein [Caudoviricetes sp.]